MSLLTLVFRSAKAERLFRLASTGYQVDLSDHSALAERKKQRKAAYIKDYRELVRMQEEK